MPGLTDTLGILESVIIQEGLAVEILPVTSTPSDWSDFPGSPTILVNSENLFPAERGDARAALAERSGQSIV